MLNDTLSISYVVDDFHFEIDFMNVHNKDELEVKFKVSTSSVTSSLIICFFLFQHHGITQTESLHVTNYVQYK